MFGFLKIFFGMYKISKKNAEIMQKFAEMQEDMKHMGGKEFKAKYEGNPARAWALLRWEKEKLRREKAKLGL